MSLPLTFHWPKQVTWPWLMSKCEAWHTVPVHVLERRGEQGCGCTLLPQCHWGALELGLLGQGDPSWLEEEGALTIFLCMRSTQVP